MLHFNRNPIVIVVGCILLFSCGEEQNALENEIINSDQLIEDTALQYFVAQTGSDVTGDGTLSLPWQSISHAVGSVSTSQENVTLNLRGGTHQLANTLSIHDWPGVAQNLRLVIRSYDGEVAVLDGGLIADFGAMISIRNSHYITISGLELTNLIGNKSGIHVTGNSSNIKISDNEVYGMHWTTDEAAASAPAPEDNLNPIVIVGDSADAMREISVTNNEVYDVTTGYSEAIKVTGNIDGFLVEGNEVYDVSNIGIVAAGNYAWVGLDDMNLNQARNGIIRNNEVYRCVSPVAASAGIYVDGARDINVIDNYSHDNTVGFSVGSEQPGAASTIVLSGNVSADNSQAGVVIGTISPDSMVEGIRLVGNEIRGNYTSPVWGGAPIVVNKSKNITIQENDIRSISQYMVTVNAASDGLSLNRNSYESSVASADQAVFSWLGITNQNYTGFESYRSETGQDSFSTFSHAGDSIFATLMKTVKNIFK